MAKENRKIAYSYAIRTEETNRNTVPKALGYALNSMFDYTEVNADQVIWDTFTVSTERQGGTGIFLFTASFEVRQP